MWKFGNAVSKNSGQRLLITGSPNSKGEYYAQTENMNGFLIPGDRFDFVPESGDLQRELAAVLNKYSAESVSGTPDFILAEFMLNTLKNFNEAVSKRAEWRGDSLDFRPRPQPSSDAFKVGDTVRIKNTFHYNGRIGTLQPNSGDPEDIWAFNVLLDEIEGEGRRVIGVTVDHIEDFNEDPHTTLNGLI